MDDFVASETNLSITTRSSLRDEKRAIAQILTNAQMLRGYTLSDLTRYLKITKPENMVHAKGLVGQIIEILLGATAKSRPLPDFPELGLEIKTLPVDLNGKPLESTYVCTAPLIPRINLEQQNSQHYSHFKNSTVYKKLAHVLWIPIIVHKNNQTITRTIGNAFLWQPNDQQLELLATDWSELTEMLYTGNLDSISSHYGQVLQIRPKAKDSKALTSALGHDGQKILALPRGFYLRPSFTKLVCSLSNNGIDVLP